MEWNAPTSINQNGILTIYEIQYNGIELDVMSMEVNVSVGTFSQNLTELEAGVTYCVTIRVATVAGFSQPSAPMCVRIPETGI